MRKERLELSRVAPLEPKSSASTNSATFAVRFAALSSAAQYTAIFRIIEPLRAYLGGNSALIIAGIRGGIASPWPKGMNQRE